MHWFTLRFVLLLLFLGSGSYFISIYLDLNLSPLSALLPVIVIGTITYFSHLSLAKTFSMAPIHFVRRYLLLTLIRFFGYLAFPILFIYFNRLIAKQFILLFLVNYMIFLVFEGIELSAKRTRTGKH